MDKLFIIVIYTLVLIIVLFINLRSQYKQISIEKVKKRTDEEKLKDINDILNIYGFLFHLKEDIVCSTLYAPQRNFGYCTLYDELAPALKIKIDCEPIYFQYDGRRWLIEFWKGQYGCVTGAEVGVYVTDKDDIDIPGIFSGTFYECVSDNELLEMQYNLKKHGKEIIKIQEKHWWLTGFQVGMFSETDQLSLDIQIKFPYEDMQKAFIQGLYNAGYTSEEIVVIDKIVQVTFKEPKTKQPQIYGKIYLKFIQKLNKFYCDLFNWIAKDFTRTIDKIDFLRIYYPITFKIMGNTKKLKKLDNLYENIKDYIRENKL